MTLTNKTVLITGAAGGIGAELCRLLLAEGAQLVLNSISATQLVALQLKLGSTQRTVVADVGSTEGRMAIVQACSAAGGVDAVVNLAGILDFDMYNRQSDATVTRIIEVNTLGPMLLCKSLLTMLLARPSARIVNVGSIFGSIGHPGFAAYCASKAAIKIFSEALGRELADTNVSVAYIAPRATNTNLNPAKLNALNAALGTRADAPELVAREIVAMLAGNKRLRYLGWPEKLFVYINAILPAVVFSALAKKLSLIKKFAQQ
ncbi:MAG: SDR family oxidoreductase [Pseudomonadota bacterium]